MQLSIVSPVYLAEKILPELVARLSEVLPTCSEEFEIILVEDGSPDNSWKVIEEICDSYPFVKGIKLSRNFGQHAAITCGLEATTGERIIVMDCDLQDSPDEIPALIKKSDEGYDIVFAVRENRKDKFLKKLTSKWFYALFGYLTSTKMDASIANFGIYSRKSIDSVLAMNDSIRYFPTMIQWVGFNSTKLKVNHQSRFEGESSYNWFSLIRLAGRNIIAFSDKPLRLTIRLGFFMSFISFLIGVVYLYRYFTGGIQVMGFTSIILAIIFLSGLIIFILGIIGVYLGKMFEQVKERPKFIIHKVLNDNE